jgi:hypothetical protein
MGLLPESENTTFQNQTPGQQGRKQ